MVDIINMVGAKDEVTWHSMQIDKLHIGSKVGMDGLTKQKILTDYHC